LVQAYGLPDKHFPYWDLGVGDVREVLKFKNLRQQIGEDPKW
jgi:hypothetical protein